MKTQLVAGLVLLAASSSIIPSARADNALIAFRSRLTDRSILLPKETPRHEIVAHLGQPDAILSPNVWVYWQFETNQPNRTASLDTLLIVFRHDRVAQIKLVEGAAVRAFLDKQERTFPTALRTPLLAAEPRRRK